MFTFCSSCQSLYVTFLTRFFAFVPGLLSTSHPFALDRRGYCGWVHDHKKATCLWRGSVVDLDPTLTQTQSTCLWYFQPLPLSLSLSLSPSLSLPLSLSPSLPLSLALPGTIGTAIKQSFSSTCQQFAIFQEWSFLLNSYSEIQTVGSDVLLS